MKYYTVDDRPLEGSDDDELCNKLSDLALEHNVLLKEVVWEEVEGEVRSIE